MLVATLPSRLVGQFPPLTVPKGLFRADLSGSFFTADRRFRAGESENLATDFVRTALGTNFFPDLEPADQLIRNITGATGPQLNLGTSSATHQVTTGTLGIGLAYGLTPKITLFGLVPWVRVKVRSTMGIVAGSGRAGFNPADPVFGTTDGLAQSDQFFGQFDAALATLEAKLAAGDYDGDPALRALAQSTLASAGMVRDDLRSLTVTPGTSSPFLPLRTSASGGAIRSVVSGIQTTLSGSLGVTGFTNEPVLPLDELANEDFERFVSEGLGPVAGSLETPSLSALGDAEVGLAVTLVDGLSANPARGVRIAAQGLARLPTGTLADSRRFFDVGTGEKQTDVEGTLVADAVRGRFGIRLLGGYSLQLAGTAQRRITAPDQPIPYAYRLASVSRDPGDLITLGATPAFRFAESFALTGGAVWRHKGGDAFTYAGGDEPIPGIDAALLGSETDGSWTTATVGLTFSAPQLVKGDRVTHPIDAGVAWEGLVQSSGPVRVTRNWGVRFWLRLYTRVF